MDWANISSAIATRYGSGSMTAPAGYRAVRVSTHQLPNQLPPTPCILVVPRSGQLVTGGGTSIHTAEYAVQFFYDQAQDLARSHAALLAWLPVLVAQLRGAVQLGGLVDRATVTGWNIGHLDYNGVVCTGIELTVTVEHSEAWSPTP